MFPSTLLRDNHNGSQGETVIEKNRADGRTRFTAECTLLFGLHLPAIRNVVDPNHNRTVIRQPSFTGAMIVSARGSGRSNECAIAKSVVDPKAIAFGGVPGPLAARPISEPPEIGQLTL